MEINDSLLPVSQRAEFKTPAFTPRQISELRGRLGLSRADFARSMNVSLELIYEWQDGRSLPSAPQRSYLARLAQHADEYSEKVAMRPSLEMALRDRKVDQIHSAELVLSEIVGQVVAAN